MTPLNSIKRFFFAGLTILSALTMASGCSSDSGTCKNCNDSTFKPNADIKFIDALSHQDIFFGTGQKFSASQVKIKHVHAGIIDSIPAPLTIDSARHVFNIDLRYETDVDTLSVQVGTLKPQFLYLGTGILPGCCAKVVITSINYHNKLIFRAPTDPAKQAKLTNKVTVPFQYQ